ncbi:Uncharacterised protein [uncultured Clostridium sp.]|uniref:hypothetical protein n=1 Tax=uncultured Clostridium sp. TaxID=59620 RepID=UPI00082083EB|nr:hypothetical protein [uncultured Clostridium sp.]SCJ61269.1 Uncharacterised protein [uncultured Clostridium sp.]
MFKRKFTTLILISLIIESLIIIKPLINSNASFKLPCTCDDEFNSFYTDDDSSNTKYIDIFWTENNLKLLNENERKILDDIQNRMITNNRLDKEDIEQMATLKDVVFKSKLTEDEFADFKEIIEKKRNREKLTTEEVIRIKSYFTSIQ